MSPDPFRFDPLRQRYPSQRFPLYARGGMVNCSSPQAAAAQLKNAGLESRVAGEGETVTAQLPAAGYTIAGGSTVVLST